MDTLKFAQAISRIRVLETRLLDKSKIDKMIEANSYDESFKVLLDSEYIGAIESVDNNEDYEKILNYELSRVYSELYKMSPKCELVDLMSIKYDYHNIKVLLKGMFLKKDLSNILLNIGNLDIKSLRSAIESNDFSDYSKIRRLAIEQSIEDFNAEKDPQRIDIILDKYMFEEMLLIAKSLEYNFITKYVKTLIDLNNIKILLRVKKQGKSIEFLKFVMIDGGTIDTLKFLDLFKAEAENLADILRYTDYFNGLVLGIEDYTKNESINLLEKVIDNYIMDMMKNAKMVPFGMESIIAYIYAKETEAQIIRIILVGKQNDIANGVIMERLRDIYV